ncbi:hypothetical protein GYMLUDRAFT_234210 [Collybiopsis luxurians FD-317 M1]|uniref:Uncharacterized protein n=1 Tax=Collybiopsis luxurians FD-317 M1 TaxID=944289 RepID=A0A0D0BAK6_9AGAR|nr:hypothetical protein GYMLUDRAFT_234210 [Collybiopsis luxurians FD-317 M1]
MEAGATFSITNNSCIDLHQCRSLFQIIWSCVSVLIACTWVSVHPNIPAPDDNLLVIFGKRIGLMIMALIAPELLVLWAARQWYAAKQLSKEYKDKKWTVSHGHFFIMGGFARYCGDDFQEILRYCDHKPPIYPEEADFVGSIKRREVKDRSHKDGLAKLIAVGQTAWFVVQLLARWVQHLPITKLEIMTFAFAVMDVLIYCFWWNKPQGVRCHVRVPDQLQRREEEPAEKRMAGEAPERGTPSTNDQFHNAVSSFVKAAREKVYKWDISYRLDVLAHEKGLALKFRAWLEMMGLIFLFPITTLFDVIFLDNGTLYKSFSDQVVSFARTPKLEPSNKMDQYIAYLAAILFGAIHCAAWVFAFPSAIEQTLWRISSIIVSCAPIILIIGIWIAPAVSKVFKWLVFDWMIDVFECMVMFTGIVIMLGYIAARFTLAVLSVLTLRNLPPEAYQTVDWTAFVPHI